METNHPIQAITSINEQPCTTCIKYHESMKESISQLDQKMNLILRRFDEIISATTTAKEQPLLKQNGINANGCSESERSSSVLSPHDATRSATEEEEDFVDLKANNSNTNNGNGARKRKQPQNGGAPKLPKQDFNNHENSNFFNNSMPVLTEENSPMTNQQLLDTLTLATALGGSDANNEVLNAFFQSGILDDPNAFMNVLSASLQDGGSGFTPDSDAKKKPARKSPKQQAAASPAGSLPFLSSNVKTEDFSEEQLREALAISVEASTQQCSNCYTTKTSAWRRAQDGNLICNACGLYFRMHQTNRPIYLRKNHIQTRYRKKNAAGINGESSATTSMMVMDDENNNDLNNSTANSSFFNSGFEALLATPTMAK